MVVKPIKINRRCIIGDMRAKRGKRMECIIQ